MIKVKKLNANATIPKYQTEGASGFDFHAAKEVTILAGNTVLIPTGLAFEMPENIEMQIRPRSGMSLKTGLRVANAPGTIDSDYRGEVCIIMTNTGNDHQFIKVGDRIAQGVICPILKVEFEEVDSLEDTDRGEGGFGHTGSK